MIDRLGPLEEWPTYILHLFIDHLTPTRTSGLKKVIAFLYGNGVPLKMPYTFYIACIAEDQTWEWHCDWSSSPSKRHIAEYYVMFTKRVYYINGWQFDQREPVVLEETEMLFGIDDTTHPLRIRRRLEEIQEVELGEVKNEG